MHRPYSKRKWPTVKTRPTLAPALLAAHSACHVCRINNAGLHFYDVPEWMLRSHLFVEGFPPDYDSARDKRAERATHKSSARSVVLEKSRPTLSIRYRVYIYSKKFLKNRGNFCEIENNEAWKLHLYSSLPLDVSCTSNFMIATQFYHVPEIRYSHNGSILLFRLFTASYI